MFDLSTAYAHNLWWKFFNTTSLWSRFMHSKYKKLEPQNFMGLSSISSHVWKRMQLVGNAFNENCDTINGRWLFEKNGEFSIKSAWHLAREKGCVQRSFSLIWDVRIAPKISVFLWHLLQEGVSIDEYLKRIKIPIVSKCRCCIVGKEENRDHLFFTSPLARSIWKQFSNLLGFSCSASTFKGNLMTWWTHSKGEKIRATLCRLIPPFICWHLWCARNKCNFEGVPMKESYILNQVCAEINRAFRIKPFNNPRNRFCNEILDAFHVIGAHIATL